MAAETLVWGLAAGGAAIAFASLVGAWAGARARVAFYRTTLELVHQRSSVYASGDPEIDCGRCKGARAMISETLDATDAFVRDWARVRKANAETFPKAPSAPPSCGCHP